MEIAREARKAGLYDRALYILWRLYDREEIVDRLDVVCPGHGFVKTGRKIRMPLRYYMWMNAIPIRQS